MALQTGKVKLQGRVGNLIFYRMNGKYYARAVSSLNGRRVKRDPKFKRTMEFARIFGEASKMASALHRSLPANQRNYKLYRKITGQANQLLKSGMEKAVVELELKRMYLPAVQVLRKNIATRRIAGNIVMPSLIKPAAAFLNCFTMHTEVNQELKAGRKKVLALQPFFVDCTSVLLC